MLDSYDLVKAVIESGGRARIKKHYGVDTTNYDWVESYLRDKEIRRKIKDLQEKIPQIQAAPIHKAELKVIFKENLVKIKEALMTQIQDLLIAAQNRKVGDADLLSILGSKITYPFILLLSEVEIDALFSRLGEGTKQSEIDKSVQQTQKQIKELNEKIERELSPQDRWFHFDSGHPEPYPGGCRWTLFVKDWEKVVSRFEGGVDIEGGLFETGEENKAFYALGLDKVRKITPLRNPHKQREGAFDIQKHYDESVKISFPKDS